jgi:hypothetical protein
LSRAGRKYGLIIYTRTMSSWWPKLLTLGILLAALAWGLERGGFHRLQWGLMAALAGLVFLGTLVVWALRKAAYVQPHPDHLRIATPLFRLRISYRRIRRASSASMQGLFPPKGLSRGKRSLVQPLSRMTAMMVELTGNPLPRAVLLLFLSPLFFKDRTPHIVLLVQDWMRFSDELESFRGANAVWATRQRFGVQVPQRR